MSQSPNRIACVQSIRLLVVLISILPAIGCHWYSVDIDQDRDPLTLRQVRPRSVAVLPVYNLTRRQDLDKRVRLAVQQAVESKADEVLAIETLDRAIEETTRELGLSVYQIPPTTFRRLGLADSLLYVETLEASESWLPFMGTARLQLRVNWLEARRGAPFFRTDMMVKRRFWGIPISAQAWARSFTFVDHPVADDSLEALIAESSRRLSAILPSIGEAIEQDGHPSGIGSDVRLAPEVKRGVFVYETPKGAHVAPQGKARFDVVRWGRDQSGEALDDLGPVYSGARYWFEIELAEPAYIYMFQYDTALNLEQLFPSQRYSTGLINPIEPGQAVEFPLSEGSYKLSALPPDRSEVTETIFLLISAEPCDHVVSLYNSFLDIEAALGEPDSRVTTGDRIRAIDRVINNLLAPPARSACYRFTFEHLSAP